jgi:hypothetical protein
VRGFGYLHDGTVGTVEQFLTAIVFLLREGNLSLGTANLGPNPEGIPVFNDTTNPFDSASGISTAGIELRQELASFVLAFDSNMFPIVGQQVTLQPGNASEVASRLALLEAQAAAGDCDLVARAAFADREHGFTFSGGVFVPDVAGAPPLTTKELEQLVGLVASSITITAVPPGSGWRIGIDRDGDGYADGTELLIGSDPANPNSTPAHHGSPL